MYVYDTKKYYTDLTINHKKRYESFSYTFSVVNWNFEIIEEFRTFVKECD